MRSTDLNAILFPVDLRDLTFTTKDGKTRPVPSHRVVVNRYSSEPVGVVGQSYRLVTNQEAVDYGRQCASQLFGNVKPEALEVFNVYAPARGWCCHVDLMHKGWEVNIWKQEVYLPFVRVTNSYNATRALRFDVGYCRKVCSNGVVFEEETIRFTFAHSRESLRQTPSFEVGKGKLDGLRQKFTATAELLHGYAVPASAELPLFFKALALPLPPTPQEITPRQKEFFQALTKAARNCLATYTAPLGRNGYAVFNAATDFATHPPEIKYFQRNPHAMQMAAGTWARAFAGEMAKGSEFKLDAYLDGYRVLAEWQPQQLGLGFQGSTA